MGKKYTTVSAAPAVYNVDIEPLFEVTAYEGIKPSRAKAVVRHNAALRVLEAEMRAERVSNHKASTDKQGKRPAESAERRTQSGCRKVGVLETHFNKFSLFQDGDTFLLERSYLLDNCVSQSFDSLEEVEYWLGQYEFGSYCASEYNLFERLLASHSYSRECECALCDTASSQYLKEMTMRLSYESYASYDYSRPGRPFYVGWGCYCCNSGYDYSNPDRPVYIGNR